MSETRSPGAHSAAHVVEAVPEGMFVVRLRPRVFRLAWLGIYFLHGICGLFYAVVGIIFIWSRGLRVVEYLIFWNVIIHPAYFVAVGIVHLVICGVHAAVLVRALLRTCFFMRRSRTCGTSSHSRGLSNHPKILSIAKQVYDLVCSRRGLLGIESRQFDGVLLVREVLETAFQSYQAYQMCWYLYRRGLIRLYVGTLVLNCWVTPVLHHIIKSRPLQRLLGRLLNVLLDFAASIGVPLVVVGTYARQFDPDIQDFPTRLYDDEAWAVTLRNESPIVLFGSWLDVISRSIELLVSLGDIKLLLHRQSIQIAVQPFPSKPKPSADHAKQSQIFGVVHKFLIVYGFVVLAVHIQSELVASVSSCRLQLRPWFVSLRTCAIVEFNCCTDRELTAKAAQFDAIMGDLYPLRLVQLSFRHCNEIEVQSSIEKFGKLTRILFYNSTILQWDGDAAITDTYHPNLASIYFARTSLPNGSLPEGMRSYDFPRQDLDVAFSMTNLASLPKDLDTRWASKTTLIIELSELTEFPLVLTRMKLDNLALVTNRITQVPAAAFEIQGLNLLSLSGNPLTSLPEDVNLNSLNVLMVYSTNLTTLPKWVMEAAWNGVYVRVGRTPYCSKQLLDANTSTLDSGDQVSGIDCQDNGPVSPIYQVLLDARPDEVW